MIKEKKKKKIEKENLRKMTDVDPPIELNAIVKIYAESKGNEEKCQRKEARYSIVKYCMMENSR
jgi:hypothetical protein